MESFTRMKAGPILAALALCASTAAASGAATAQGAKPDPEKVGQGEQVYADYCQVCHGDNLVSSGQTFDLRKLKPDERERYQRAVLNGKGQMPPWKGVIDDAQIDAVWAYIMSKGG
jgi:mono/diheme cytochrome c family protein